MEMTKKMTSKERVAAVFENRMPDRAPVCDFGNAAMAGQYGRLLKECRGNVELTNSVMVKWSEETQSDLVFGPVETKGIFMDLPGLEIKLPDDNQGSLKSNYFNTPEDVASKPLFDPFNQEECPYFYRYVVDIFKGEHEACTNTMTPAWCEGVLTTSGFLRGIDELLMEIFIEPDNAKKAISRGAEFSRQIVEAELENVDADYVIYTDPVSSADMIDDKMFREFNLEHLHKNITGWKNKYGVDTMLHICGDTTPMLEDFTDTGARVISLDHSVDLAGAREVLGDRMVIMGNIDPVSVLLRGSVDDVDRTAEKCFDDAGRDGDYIFGAGCAVPNHTPLENIVQMSVVSRKHPY